MAFHVPEQYRITGRVPLASTAAEGHNGAFRCRLSTSGEVVTIIASDGEGWEHVSVSRTKRVPSWAEMCEVKALFWDPEDCVVQFHPPASEYVNAHPNCLHLWRPTGAVVMPRPPRILVGP